MPDYVNRHLGILRPMEYTVKIVHQELNIKPSAKDTPYFYKVETPDFAKLTTEELNHLFLEAQAIEARIQNMLAERG